MIIKFLKWLIIKLEGEQVMIPQVRPLTLLVRPAMELVDKLDASGMYKHNLVINKIKRINPNISKADINLEIELLYQEFFKHG